MNSKLMAGGIALVFMALALPTNAYHIADTGAPNDQSGFQPVEWGAQAGANVYYPGAPVPSDPTGIICGVLDMLIAENLEPTVTAALIELRNLLCGPDGCFFEPCLEEGDFLIGFGNIVCEVQPDPLGSGDPGNSGAGGLCFMNPGFEDATVVLGVTTDNTEDCNFAADGDAQAGLNSNGVAIVDPNRQGNSNSHYNPYVMPTVGLDLCNSSNVPQPVIMDVKRQWYRITMQLDHPVANPATDQVDFAAQIGSWSCLPAADVVYDDQFAYVVNGGHVAGFPVSFPEPNGDGSPHYGGYWVESVAGPGARTACDAPAPMYT